MTKWIPSDSDIKIVEATIEEAESQLAQLLSTKSANRITSMRKSSLRAAEEAFRNPDKLIVIATKQGGFGFNNYLGYITEPPDKNESHPSKGYIVHLPHKKTIEKAIEELDNQNAYARYRYFWYDQDNKMVSECTLALSCLGEPTQPGLVPSSNQGRNSCWWCNSPTKKVPGFKLDIYDICPKCKK